MPYMRESDLGAIFAGAQNRPAEELVTALRKGNHLRKYGRRGKPKTHYFRLSHDDKDLVWDSSNGKARSIFLASVIRVQQGQNTEVFLRDPLPECEALSFSLIYTEGRNDKKVRSLDVICKNLQEFETWFWGIQLVIAWAQQLEQQLDAATVAAQEASIAAQTQPKLPANGTATSACVSEKKLQEFKQIAAALQPTPQPSVTAKALPALQPIPSVTAAGVAAGPTRQRLSGLLGLPEKREIGDCYIWGDWGDLEAFASCAAAETCALQSCCVPVMVANTHALDIIQVAVGARHAALLTRGGEVYTWGSGQGGKLGNGSTARSFFPYQVTRLSGKGTVAVACGHSYSAAVLADGSMYTWGTGLGGQLGLGPSVVSAVWPMRVTAGLESIRVDNVSCGPFHAAAISSDGRLFTWGDGAFGKLGHGVHASCDSPRQVKALADHWVVSVGCGWWHSAAAAAPRSSRPGHSRQTSTETPDGNLASSDPGAQESRTSGRFSGNPPGRSSYRSMRSSSMGCNRVAPLPSEMGGWLFTWGGDFTWQQRGKRDHHEGCLGLGDLSGRLVPTMVKGEDDIKQVACGLNFTVALTGNGEVLQMGSTGAQNSREHNAMWEGARVPVLVSGQMATHFAEGIAAGMSHVAVVATQRGKNSVVASSGAGQVTRLLTWGQGARGQLGIGESRNDHVLPQVVTTVAGRKILYLACGGHYTLAVCEHDPRMAQNLSRDSGEIETLTLPILNQTSLISSSGPSRMTLGAAAAAGGAAGTGTSGDRGAAAARTASAPGPGGLTLSASFGSLASSAQSSTRGEAGSGGGMDGGRSFVLRKSDRGKLESRHSERGLAVHQSLQLQQGSLFAGPSRGANPLSRSLDRSIGCSGGLGSVSVGIGDSAKGVSFAANPATIFGGDRRGEKNAMTNLRDREKGDLDPSMMSLQALAGASKKSRLAFTKSFKNVLRNDSNNSSNSSRHGWSPLHQQHSGKTSTRQGSSNITNSSVRSETDLMTISTDSSLSSMTPSASNHSLMMNDSARTNDAAAGEGSSGMVTPIGSAAAPDFAKQLRYWQERAANMEQQLVRKTHELEQLRQDLEGTTAAQQQGYPKPQLQGQQQQVSNSMSVAAASAAGGESRSHQNAASKSSGAQQQQQQQQEAMLDEQQHAAAAAKSAEVLQQPGAAAVAVPPAVKSDDSGQLARGTSLIAWVKSRTPDGSNTSSRTTTVSASGAASPLAAAGGNIAQQQQQRASRRGRSGSADSFKFDMQLLNPAAPTGLEALREVMGTGSPVAAAADSGGGAAAVTGSSVSRTARRTNDSVAGQGREVVLQDDAFQEMGQHSDEAHRVLALFQQSHRHRQELAQEQQQQQQQTLQAAPAAPAVGTAHRSDAADVSEDVVSSSPAGNVSAVSTMSPFALTSPPVVSARQQQPQQGTLLLTRRLRNSSSSAGGGASPVSPALAASMAASAAAAAGPDAASPPSVSAAQRLSSGAVSENLQQQQQQQQPGVSSSWLPPAVQQQMSPPSLLRGGSGTVPVISLSTASAAAGPGHRHRRTVSVDISSNSAGYLTHEVSPGVYLSLQALDSGVGYELKRVRFAKQIYSAADADAWWAANKATIYAAYCIVEPSGDDQQQQRGQSTAAGGSGRSSTVGAGTSGVPASARDGSTPAVDLHSNRFSTSDLSSSIGSPTHSTTGNASTYELDIFQQAGNSSRPATASYPSGGDNLSRLGRAASAASRSGSKAPGAQVYRRINTSSGGSSAAVGSLSAMDRVVAAVQGNAQQSSSSPGISSMVRTPSQQSRSVSGEKLGLLKPQQGMLNPNGPHNELGMQTEEKRLAGQGDLALLNPRESTTDDRLGVSRYSQADPSSSTEPSSSGSVLYSPRASSSEVANLSASGVDLSLLRGVEQKRGSSGSGGLFKMFSRSSGSGGDGSTA